MNAAETESIATSTPDWEGARPTCARDKWNASRQRCLVVWGLVALLMTWLWLQHRRVNSARDGVAVQTAALNRMIADARFIKSASTSPKRAAERERPHEELLAQIESALADAGINPESWQDSVPQPPQKLGDSGYTRMGTRIYLECLSMELLTRFGYHLVTIDPSLKINSVRIRTHRDTKTGWDSEIMISYLVVE